MDTWERSLMSGFYSSTDLGLLLHVQAQPFPLVKPFTRVRVVILGFIKL